MFDRVTELPFVTSKLYWIGVPAAVMTVGVAVLTRVSDVD
jgi:hypothetical protein